MRGAPTAELRIHLQSPEDGADLTGNVTFQWSANSALPLNQAFELIFWKPGQDALKNGFGLAPPSSKVQITIDLDALDKTLGDLFEPGDYHWGVRLLEKRNDEYIRVLSFGQNRITYRRASSNNQ